MDAPALALFSLIRAARAFEQKGCTSAVPLPTTLRTAADRAAGALTKLLAGHANKVEAAVPLKLRGLRDHVREVDNLVVAGIGMPKDLLAAIWDYRQELARRMRAHEGGEELAEVLEMLPQSMRAVRLAEEALAGWNPPRPAPQAPAEDRKPAEPAPDAPPAGPDPPTLPDQGEEAPAPEPEPAEAAGGAGDDAGPRPAAGATAAAIVEGLIRYGGEIGPPVPRPRPDGDAIAAGVDAALAAEGAKGAGGERRDPFEGAKPSIFDGFNRRLVSFVDGMESLKPRKGSPA